MKNTSFYPWKNRPANPITVRRRFKFEKNGNTYEEMNDGSIRNPNHERNERKFYGLSARQHRNMKKRLRREESAVADVQVQKLAA